MSGPWWLVIGMGAITYALRLLPILLLGRGDPPPILRRGLRLVPAAILSALIVPDLLLHDGQLAFRAANPRLLGGLLATLVAWRTKNIALTLVAGMVGLWLTAAFLE